MSVEHEQSEYVGKTGRSRALHEEALGVMPGGNSRTTTFFDPYPFYIERGQGAHVWDADGNDRLDFNGNYTSLILGHAPPTVLKARLRARSRWPPSSRAASPRSRRFDSRTPAPRRP
jgi:4-aminobutyrate aminotransferase-like enzyme